jgi:glycosyltransferase involved in cell wall biosynthesis
MKGRVHLAGHLGQEEVSRLLPHCITLSPLTGLALIECGLAGSPIVAYDRDWQAEFVDDGVNGFIVAFRDVDSLAECALRLIGDPQLAGIFSTRIREKALEFADPVRLARLEAETFDRLLGRSAE